MEAAAGYYGWLHKEMGYTFEDIPRRTHAELNTLQLAWLVKQEQREDQMNAAQNDTTTLTQRRQREHKDAIARRLRQN